MNCYSCPLSLFACPIGSLQATLSAREYGASLYVLGLILLFGSIFGRLVCGFLCPFGLIQDLLFKIPFQKKIRLVKGEKILRWTRFIALFVLVLLLPAFVSDFAGLGEPWFCKFVCPVGTLEGGIPLVLLNGAMRGAAGFLFRWKIAILLLVIIASVAIYRPFCRFLCPLGAIYGAANRFSFHRIFVDSEKCTKCAKCQKECKLAVPVWKNPASADCIHCGDCVRACPHSALKMGFFKKI